MDIAYFPNSVAKNGHSVMASMISALEARGHRVIRDSMSADAAVIWSLSWAGKMRSNQAVFDHYRQRSRDVLIIEVGLLNRGYYWKVGLNGTVPRHHLATGSGTGRSQLLGVDLKPWRNSRGQDILICPQRSRSGLWENMPEIETWIQNTIDRIRQHSDRRIVVRPHPRQKLRWHPAGCTVISALPVVNTYDDFNFTQALDQAWAVVNHNSHTGTQSIIQGIPAFVDGTSPAAPVANLDFSAIENPMMPDRQDWFDDLCWTEFSIKEIQQGLPLDLLEFA